jgi:hypothetical protein
VNVRILAPLPVLAAALAFAPAAGAPPTVGELVPGESLAGVELGMTTGDVLAAWGDRHGVCRNCAAPTWYFNLRPFAAEGAGVVFRRGRVAHVFTLWRPPGWRTDDGLELGASASAVEDEVAVDERIECGGYTALLVREGSTTTAYYLYRDELWGFGLLRASATPCV